MGCGCNKKISGMKRRKKAGKVPYKFLGGAALGAGASVLVNKVTDKIDIFVANPSYNSFAKVVAGVGVMMYGGKNEIIQGIGAGMVVAGGSEVIANTGVLDTLTGGTVAGLNRGNYHADRQNLLQENARLRSMQNVPMAGRRAA